MFDMIPRGLVARLKQQRAQHWAAQHRAALTAATRALADCKAATGTAKGTLSDEAQRTREELEARLKLLQEGAPDKEGVDPGPLIEVVAWHDGALWRVALDTSDLYIKPEDRFVAGLLGWRVLVCWCTRKQFVLNNYVLLLYCCSWACRRGEARKTLPHR